MVTWTSLIAVLWFQICFKDTTQRVGRTSVDIQTALVSGEWVYYGREENWQGIPECTWRCRGPRIAKVIWNGRAKNENSRWYAWPDVKSEMS